MCLAAYNYSRSIGVTAARRLPKPEARVRPPYTAPEKNNPSSGAAKNIPDSAEYRNYGAETESSSGGSGVRATGGYTYTGGGNGSGNGGKGSDNGYAPPETPTEEPAENQWVMSVLQSTKTFDEWLKDEGKRFKYSGDDEQNRAYWAYVSSKAKEGGLDEDETYIFRKQVESKNS